MSLFCWRKNRVLTSGSSLLPSALNWFGSKAKLSRARLNSEQHYNAIVLRNLPQQIHLFRFREGQRNRKEQIGTVEQFPTRKAVCELLRTNINREARSPRTVKQLWLLVLPRS